MQVYESDLFSIAEASAWASQYLNKNITNSNIAYLIQYAVIRKIGDNGSTQVSKSELKKYYDKIKSGKENAWKDKLGDDLNWHLAFDNLKEAETTKHVHRLHPYKGKFIPQLAEYFLDERTDDFKKETYFKKGDIVLDPFCGSGTTLVEANELSINAIGVDVSAFNSLITNCKISKVDLAELEKEIKNIIVALQKFVEKSNVISFENELLERLNAFNNQYFPAFDYKIKIREKSINEKEYSKAAELQFLPIYKELTERYKIGLKNETNETFLDKWFLPSVVGELRFVSEIIKNNNDLSLKNILTLILSRTMRSCRATTHSDLATLLEPINTTYYCSKHYKICKPLFSILKWWKTYSADTIKRLKYFEKIKTDTFQLCLTGDSRNIDLFEDVYKLNKDFYEILKNKKISGIFSSPPYVGLIDYHEQHAYAYDLFGFDRRDALEIGPLFKGQGLSAREAYVKGISEVLINAKKYMAKDFNIFLVANDKYNLYPKIAELSGLKIVNRYKRPVLNRTEKDKNAYAEIIFHMKGE